jgi:tRNA pseudouridine13 synthase
MEADGPEHDPWRALALDPPRAWGETPVSGALRVELSDFDVEERLGFEPDGGVAHRLLLVEKSGTNTVYVARALAVRAGRPAGDFGFAGQ